jgi:hypothetical protein
VTDELPPWHHDKPWSPLELDDIRHNWTETPERFSYAAGRWLATLDAARSRPDEAGLREAIERRAAVMERWAADPEDGRPAGRWLSLPVALAILRGTHPALAQPAVPVAESERSRDR